MTKYNISVGDTIECLDADDAIDSMTELAKLGIETDFLYKKNSVEGIWLRVVKIDEVD